MNKISYKFDPFEISNRDAPKKNINKIKKEIAEFVLDQVLNNVGHGKSPVKGEAWKKSLSPNYKKVKSKLSSSSIANMELTGSMLDRLEVKQIKDGDLELRIVGREADKADGHCQLSGRKSRLPKRRFIPSQNQTFKNEIISGIKDIIDGFED